MRIALPSSNPPAATLAGLPVPALACEAVLEQLLVAHKAATIEQLLRRRPLATRWFVRRFVAPVLSASGDALSDEPSPRAAVLVLLRWALAQQRPDAAPLDAPIERAAWLDRAAWRPFLSLACHYGFLSPPDIRERYRAGAADSAADRLCGLWDVAPSSFYRYVEKGRRLLADVLLDQAVLSDRLISLYGAALEAASARLKWPDWAARDAWHVRQSDAAAARGDVRAALWHRLQAQDAAGVTRLLQRFCDELAADVRTDALLQLLRTAAYDTRTQVRLLLARSALARVRGAGDQERRDCERALRLATADDDKLMLGIVYGALGKFHEARDIDRAFACFQQSAEFLEQAGGTSAQSDPDAAPAYLSTLVHLAWLHTLRNDPRAKAVLDRAESLRAEVKPPDDTAALLEQAWGEYWRRAGDLPAALEAKHRALQIYERTANRHQVLRTYGNLALLYGQMKDYPRAIDYSQRVLALAETTAVDPETVASTYINLGAAYFWQHRLDDAIEQYRRAADCARAARLGVVAGRAHYNLAEAYYLRFQSLGHAEDERLGDGHADAALAAWPEDSDPGAVEATRNLKRELLGARQTHDVDRLLSGELAAHFEQTREVQRQRAILAVPQTATVRIEAHLAIAAAYISIAVQEREAAVALIDEHRLQDSFDTALSELRARFDRALTREQQLAARWVHEAGDLLTGTRASPLLRHLAESGSVNKSTYAQLCGVGLATASKHLGMLAERGLLQQSGRGPSTRYSLPP